MLSLAIATTLLTTSIQPQATTKHWEKTETVTLDQPWRTKPTRVDRAVVNGAGDKTETSLLICEGKAYAKLQVVRYQGGDQSARVKALFYYSPDGNGSFSQYATIDVFDVGQTYTLELVRSTFFIVSKDTRGFESLPFLFHPWQQSTVTTSG